MSRQKSFSLRPGEGVGSFMRELVFGLEDGIVSTGGAVIGIAAGTGDRAVVILSGLVIVIVEALSMAAGTYLSSKSKRQLLQSQVARARQEIGDDPEGVRRRLVELYLERGFDEGSAERLVDLLSSKREVWLEEVAARELGIGRRELEEQSGGAAVMWLSYMIGGAVPIVPFLLLPVWSAVGLAFVVSLVALFGIGWWKARVTGTSSWRGGAEMMFVAATAGVIGFIVGRIVGLVAGIDLTL